MGCSWKRKKVFLLGVNITYLTPAPKTNPIDEGSIRNIEINVRMESKLASSTVGREVNWMPTGLNSGRSWNVSAAGWSHLSYCERVLSHSWFAMKAEGVIQSQLGIHQMQLARPLMIARRKHSQITYQSGVERKSTPSSKLKTNMDGMIPFYSNSNIC